MTRDRQAREELAVLHHIEELTTGPGGDLYGCRPAPSLTRNRLQRKGVIHRFEAMPGKAGHINRWGLTDTGRAVLESTRKAVSE